MTENTKEQNTKRSNMNTKDGIIATLTLNPSFDVFVSLSDPLSVGETNRSYAENIKAGGKGINVSRRLSVLGTPTVAYFPVGKDNGELFERLIGEERLVKRTVRTEADVRKNYKFTDKSGLTTEVNGRGGPLSRENISELKSVLYADLPMMGVLVISGSLPQGVPPGTYGEIIERARSAGVRTVLDASGLALLYGVRSSPDLIKPNRRELSELTGASLLTVSDVTSAAESIYEKYGTSVLCTLGSLGSVYVGILGVHYERAQPIKNIKTTTGAGDSYLAGFLHSQRQGDTLKTSMIAGAASAAKTITSRVFAGE